MACKHCDFTMPYCIDGFDSDEPDEMFEALAKRAIDVGDTSTLDLFTEGGDR